MSIDYIKYKTADGKIVGNAQMPNLDAMLLNLKTDESCIESNVEAKDSTHYIDVSVDPHVVVERELENLDPADQPVVVG